MPPACRRPHKLTSFSIRAAGPRQPTRGHGRWYYFWGACLTRGSSDHKQQRHSNSKEHGRHTAALWPTVGVRVHQKGRGKICSGVHFSANLEKRGESDDFSQPFIVGCAALMGRTRPDPNLHPPLWEPETKNVPQGKPCLDPWDGLEPQFWAGEMRSAAVKCGIVSDWRDQPSRWTQPQCSGYKCAFQPGVAVRESPGSYVGGLAKRSFSRGSLKTSTARDLDLVFWLYVMFLMRLKKKAKMEQARALLYDDPLEYCTSYMQYNVFFITPLHISPMAPVHSA